VLNVSDAIGELFVEAALILDEFLVGIGGGATAFPAPLGETFDLVNGWMAVEGEDIIEEQIPKLLR
jgi:hypothetical protein